MAKLTEYDAESNRALTARQEFIDRFCAWWPAVYKNLLPVTYDVQTLALAKGQIEQLMKDDFEAYRAEQESPWMKLGPVPRMLDWSGLKGSAGEHFIPGAFECMAIAGMPHPIKPGREKDVPEEIEERAIRIGTRRAALEKKLRERLHALHDQGRPAETEADKMKIIAHLDALNRGEYDNSPFPESIADDLIEGGVACHTIDAAIASGRERTGNQNTFAFRIKYMNKASQPKAIDLRAMCVEEAIEKAREADVDFVCAMEVIMTATLGELPKDQASE